LRIQILILASALAATGAHAADWRDFSLKTSAGALGEVGLTANWAYDYNAFGHDGESATDLANAHAYRRRETGLFLRRKGVYDLSVGYDFEAEVWQDVALKLYSQGLFGRDVGVLRVGQFKTPVGFDAVGASRSTPFLESALPVQVAYAGRRLGAEWSLQRPHHLASLAYFGGNDLEGGNAGQTIAARAAWVPRNAAGDVLHLGLSASREEPDADKFRMRARPEVALTDVRLVDTGTLSGVETIRRGGLEGLWIHGPWSVQGEYLQASVARGAGLDDVDARGAYVFASWVATGESRAYNGYAGNVVPSGTSALELLLRYSHVDLDDGAVRGGRQSDWTVGANWYLGRNFKVQANYVFANSRRGDLRREPEAFGLRAQVQF